LLRGGAERAEERAGLDAVSLDGRDAYVEVGDDPTLDFAGDFTLSLWLVVRSGPDPTGIVVKAGTLRLLYYPRAKKFLIDLVGDRRFQTFFKGELERGTWHLLTLSHRAQESQTQVALDGRAIAQFTPSTGRLKPSSAPLRVGVGVNLAQKRFITGSVARVSFAARALPQEEIQQMSREQLKALGGDRNAVLPAVEPRDSRWPLLLVDTTQLAVNDGVSLTVCEAVKHSDNPIVRCGGLDAPDERRCHFDGSVYYLDGQFHMWYWAFPGGKAYARSDDGIRWTKPNLGLVEFRGDKDNNLVPMPGRPMIFRDPDDPDPSRRFKKAVSTHKERDQLWTVAYSPDGFHWETVDQPQPTNWENAESQILTRIGEKWIIYTQGLTGLGRTVMAFHSPTLAVPPSEWKKTVAWTMQDKYGIYQAHHGIKPWVRPGLIIGVFGIFHNRHELIDTTAELGFVLSHDGLKWWEPWPLATLVRRGPAGSWDSMFLIQGYPCFVNVRDRTFLYYAGTPNGNGGDRMQIGLATLRRDGFGYLGIDIGWTYTQPTPRVASFVTVPIRLHDKASERVLLNVDNLDADREQTVQVELLDQSGRAVPGYTRTDADPVAADGIAVPATWRGSPSLQNVTNDIIRLRVHFQGGKRRDDSPRLYAIYFHEPAEIEQ